MIQTIIIISLILIILLGLSLLMGLSIRKFDNSFFLIILYIVLILITQIITTKVVTFDIGFIAPAGVLLFPFTFQIIDTINERYGRKEVQLGIFLAFLSQIIMVLILIIVTELPGFIGSSNHPDAPVIWNQIFGFSLSITAASWIAFLISENLDAYLYQFLKEVTQNRFLWLRNLGSDLISVTIDSLLFVPLAFLIFPVLLGQFVLPFNIVFDIIMGQIVLKILLGSLDTPFIYLTHSLIEE